MEAIFDHTGHTVAWRQRDVIYDLQGVAVGWIRERALFSRDGRYLGRCEDGFYRNATGEGLGFERDATGGQLTPPPHPEPVQPPAELRPAEPAFERVPPPPMRKLRWAEGGWAALFGSVPA